ncbi:hypothetical protein [Carboxydothermus hydrogenoformans]|uniref:Uncharacterized protein n=1 Tax=Carboxydothermus hydrogenoformans (strain ATCC BAA-161 / DSM 6008 / Z-2901) TaxID=246194 RepID=Q3A991_CARHZ|nr:hypothetical protein [Carboxydothermus hydrogenoformans]ABB13681.1 hypothetical protein CHY_2499 [Carboxydothermus hydrogenoformans Z-2901]
MQRKVKDLSEKEKVLLKFLLNNGGWFKLTVVSRKFGSQKRMVIIGIKKPASTVGMLWAKLWCLLEKLK